MSVSLAIRPMDSRDIRSVLAIQSRCYDEAKQESAASFLSKLISPLQTSFVAELGEDVVGYLVSVPVQDCGPLPLHDTDYCLPGQAVALYLHDLAVWPEARSFGVAAALINAAVRSAVGIAAIGGIGFTVSLFITALAFDAEPALADQAKLGVLVASLLAAGLGSVLLTVASRRADPPTRPADRVA